MKKILFTGLFLVSIVSIAFCQFGGGPFGGGSGGSASDAAYGESWDGATTVAPSKNAVYDKIETISAGDVNWLDAEIMADGINWLDIKNAQMFSEGINWLDVEQLQPMSDKNIQFGSVTAGSFTSTSTDQSTDAQGRSINTSQCTDEKCDTVISGGSKESEFDSGDDTFYLKHYFKIEEKAIPGDSLEGYGEIWVDPSNEHFMGTTDDGINWDFSDPLADGINWESYEDIVGDQQVNWIDIEQISSSNINWDSIENVVGDQQINWLDVKEITDVNINWSDIQNFASDKYLRAESDGTVNWETVVSGSWTDTGSFLEPNTDGDGIQINDAGGTDYCTHSHDGTDYNIACKNTTEVSINSQLNLTSASTSRSLLLSNSNPRTHEIKSDYAYLHFLDGSTQMLSMTSYEVKINPSAGNMDFKVGSDLNASAVVLDASAETLSSAIAFLPAQKTSDPCGATFPEGSIFYNSTSHYFCYCNGSNDVKMSDDTTACF